MARGGARADRRAAPLLHLAAAFRSRRSLYGLLFVHALILMLGGHYTYAHVPLGFWVQDLFDLARNPLRPDRPLRAGLRAGDPRARDPAAAHAAARPAAGCSSSCAAICLAISACYELIEWWAALLGGEAAHGVPRHAGRRLGHAVGHVPRARRRGDARSSSSRASTIASSRA